MAIINISNEQFYAVPIKCSIVLCSSAIKRDPGEVVKISGPIVYIILVYDRLCKVRIVLKMVLYTVV